MSQTIEAAVEDMIATLQNSLEDAVKFDGGNASAGTRVRKALQEVTNSCKLTRASVIDIRNARKASKGQ